LSLIVDAHEDVAWNVLCFGRDYLHGAHAIRQREAGGPVEAATGVAMLGLPDWLAGNVAVIFGTLFTLPERKRTNPIESHYNTPGEAYTLAMRQIDIYERMAGESPQIKLIHRRDDLEAALRSWEGDPLREGEDDRRQVGIVYLMEGGDAIKQPDEVDLWYERGLRAIGPAWAATRYCGGTSEPGPLTDDGFRLLEAMANLNMILDTSHMAEQAFFQALDRYEGPIIASHSNPRVQSDNSDRHLSDNMIKALLDRDGVIGTVLFNKFLLRGWNHGDRKEAATIETAVRAIDYVCQMAGDARHAAIGTDFDGGFGMRSAPDGVDTVADLQKIAPALAEQGYTETDIELIMGGNWLRVLRGALP
jgi:membrane dipeptidase